MVSSASAILSWSSRPQTLVCARVRECPSNAARTKEREHCDCTIVQLTTYRAATYRAVVDFSRASYFALAALIDGPLHGYAIVRRAASLSDGAVTLSTGTLYGVLERALAEGLVVAGRPYVEGGRQRRDYTLTASGRETLVAETKRIVRAGRVVSRRLQATTVGGVS